MKKCGYTLAEALVAMGLIGVLAAIMLPMANNSRPDATKANYLKVYDSIVESVQAIVSDTSIYGLYDGDKIYLDCPLLNTNETDDMHGRHFNEGNKKICEALGYALGADDVTGCSNDNGVDKTAFSKTFTTQNGMEFMIFTHRTLNTNSSEYLTKVWVDIDGAAKGDNCWYNASTCKEPDIFIFNIYVDGEVRAADAYGRTYLKTRTNLKKKKNLTPDTYNPAADNEYKTRRYNDACRPQ